MPSTQGLGLMGEEGVENGKKIFTVSSYNSDGRREREKREWEQSTDSSSNPILGVSPSLICFSPTGHTSIHWLIGHQDFEYMIWVT